MSLPKLNSRCYLSGAIALAVATDVRVNLVNFGGFPQILVEQQADGAYTASLAWYENTVSLQLTQAEATLAIENFRFEKAQQQAFFWKVQEAVAQLEGVYSRSRTTGDAVGPSHA